MTAQAPRLVSCYFTAKVEPDGQYDRLARVLEYSAQRHCRGWEIEIARLTPATERPASGNPSHGWNTSKLDYWCARVEAAVDGARLVLIDADTVILRPLDPLWALDFDLAYTVRSAGLPLNGGVVALRVSPRTRHIMRRWRDENRRMLADALHHQVWRKKYAGINQASFGYLLEHGELTPLRVTTLACGEWNCVEWDQFDAKLARILHVKSGLRRAVFGMAGPPKHLRPLVTTWHQLERELLTSPTEMEPA